MSAAKKDIGARVDALSQALEGTEFVAAVERLAEEMDPDEKLLLQEVLVERAADEEDLQEAVRRRYAERGWTRRMLSRLEGVWRDDRADAIAAAIEAGADEKDALRAEVELLARTAVVRPSCSMRSRATRTRVRAWVPGTAADSRGRGNASDPLDDPRPRARGARCRGGGSHRSRAGRVTSRPSGSASHSSSVAERIGAMESLAAAGDATALAVIEERAAAGETPEEREAARSAAVILHADKV